jgi:hypothetical protein
LEVRSLVATAYQLGLLRHAVLVMGVPKIEAEVAAWVMVRICFSASVRSWAKSSVMPLGVRRRKLSARGWSSVMAGVGRSPWRW